MRLKYSAILLCALPFSLHAANLKTLQAHQYAYATDGAAVGVIDLDQGVLTGYVKPLPSTIWKPGTIAFSPNNNLAFITAIDYLSGNSSVAIIDTTSNQEIDQVILEPNQVPIYLAATPDGKYVYINIQSDLSTENGKIAVLDVNARKIIGYVTENGAIAQASIDHIIFAPNDKRAIVIMGDSQDMDIGQVNPPPMILDTTTHTIKQSNYGINAEDGVFSNDGNTFYLFRYCINPINRPRTGALVDEMRMIDWKTNKIMQTVPYKPCDYGPMRAIKTSDGNKIYISYPYQTIIFDVNALTTTVLSSTMGMFLGMTSENKAYFTLWSGDSYQGSGFNSTYTFDFNTNQASNQFDLNGLGLGLIKNIKMQS